MLHFEDLVERIQADISRLQPKPGEVLLVRFSPGIHMNTLEHMKDELNRFMLENFPDVRVLAIAGSIDVATISAECAAEIERTLIRHSLL